MGFHANIAAVALAITLPASLEARTNETTWWSLQPLSTPAPPSLHNTPPHWTQNPIDHFILAKLQSKGLTPAPEANRRTLIRRLTFDLIGLPPSPKEVTRFINDPDPLAYEQLVDRLLDSPHFGERWARHWLDVAHYADTHGFERDRKRENAYRYRDYVIQSFNSDKPYHQFIEEQIAGDLSNPDDPDAIIATAFLAAGPWDLVGQEETKSPVLRRAARADDLDDMVTQVITSTMALTINCARCHDHKLDPISQKDYYRLWAVFSDLKRADREINHRTTQEHNTRKETLQKRINNTQLEIHRLVGTPLDLADAVGGGNGSGNGSKGHGIDPRSGKNQIQKLGFLDNIQPNTFTPSANPLIDGVFVPNGNTNAPIIISSTGLTNRSLPETSAQAWDAIRNGPVNSQDITELNGIDYNSEGHSLLGLHANAGITFDLSEFRNLAGHGQLQFTTVAGYGGKSETGRADVRVLLDGKTAFHHQGLGFRDGGVPIKIEIPVTSRFLTLVATDSGNGIGHDQIFFGNPHLARSNIPTLTETDQTRVDQLKLERDTARQELNALGPPPRLYGITSGNAETIQVLKRGNPETPGETVTPGTLSSVPSPVTATNEIIHHRLALARWITHPANPLTRRVIVNRLWHHHFGRGIVTTPSDFGSGGSKPSHPALLDWLANELIRQGDSLKAIHRLMVTSQTYRQESISLNANAAKLDTDNRLLWRMNPRRLEAEALRDAILSVTGSLNKTLFGPGYVDFEYKEDYAPVYTYITADRPELWRRSIYRFVVRSTPQRFMTTLDCPDPASFAPTRTQTTTALQSLALLHNEFMLDQANQFAHRLQTEFHSNAPGQITRAFNLALNRNPTPEESSAALTLHRTAGPALLCRMLLNANEFIHID